MRLPFVISIPHCSYAVPEEVRSRISLNDFEILESTDMGTRELFACLPVRATLWARWSRLVVDLNRGPHQRGPLGVVPERDYNKREVHRDGSRPDAQEVERRVNVYYRPYHMRLAEALRDPEVLALFDCHSLTPIGPPGAPDAFKYRKHIVLGNNGNLQGEPRPDLGEITCPVEIILMMKEVFERHDFTVSMNDPYSGGYITTYYGQEMVRQGKASVQIEINQGLYLNGTSMRIDMERLAKVSIRLQRIFREIARRLQSA